MTPKLSTIMVACLALVASSYAASAATMESVRGQHEPGVASPPLTVRVAAARRHTTPDTWDFIDNGSPSNGTAPDSLCGQSGCPKISYVTGGQVQYDGTHAYNIFWQPFDSGWSTFRSYINKFFNDISNNGAGTGYYGNLTQYYQTDVSGGNKQSIHNYSTLLGSWADTTNPYPIHGDGRYIDKADAKQEVTRAISQNGWPTVFGDQYNIILGTNDIGGKENICDGTSCFYNTEPKTLCGWHGTAKPNNITVPYTVVAYGPSQHCWPNHCPNDTTGQCNVDGTMNVLSHETFETETDPVPLTGWFYQSGTSFYEIADLCEHNWDGETYDNGTANHSWNGTFYDLVDEYDLAEYNTANVYGCVPYGPQYP